MLRRLRFSQFSVTRITASRTGKFATTPNPSLPSTPSFRHVQCAHYSGSHATFHANPEYAFEMASSSIRFGRGVTKEIGQDLLALGLTKNVCIVTDPNMANLPPMKTVMDSLTRAGVEFEVFDEVAVEPTDASMQIAIDFCKKKQFDAFVAVGGGSAMDTAKAANVYMCHPDNDFFDFVNAPVGKVSIY